MPNKSGSNDFTVTYSCPVEYGPVEYEGLTKIEPIFCHLTRDISWDICMKLNEVIEKVNMLIILKNEEVNNK
jgi:hypothetical protein